MTDKFCIDCGHPQIASPSGDVCVNGHGGSGFTRDEDLARRRRNGAEPQLPEHALKLLQAANLKLASVLNDGETRAGLAAGEMIVTHLIGLTVFEGRKAHVLSVIDRYVMTSDEADVVWLRKLYQLVSELPQS